MLFQIYGETALYQLLGFVLVFTGLVLANEFARRTKTGGIICFLVLPAVLTVYFIAIAIGAHAGAEWALNNQTYSNMNSWFHYAKLYAATAGCIGFMMLKYKWSIGKTEWFKVFPFAIVAINILIAVASDFESGIRGAMALKEFGDRWWLSSENVWLYGGWWNWVNGIAGIVNIFCMTAWWGIYSSKDQKDMLWPDMTWCYILAYDLWNFEYTYNCLPTHSWYCGLALLLAPTFANHFWNKGGWNPEPGQHPGSVVHVCPGVPPVPGRQRVQHHHLRLCQRLHGSRHPAHGGQSHGPGRDLHRGAGGERGDPGQHHQAGQGTEEEPLQAGDLHRSERLPGGHGESLRVSHGCWDPLSAEDLYEKSTACAVLFSLFV